MLGTPRAPRTKRVGGWAMRTEKKTLKMLVHKNHRSGWAPTILAVLATFLAAHPARAAEAQLQQVNDRVVEISGGSGREAWSLRYGILLRATYKSFMDVVPLLAVVEGNRAWYAYGGWL